MGISTIIPDFLYLGAARDTKNVQDMQRHGITHIVSCAGKVHLESGYTIIKGHLEDEVDQEIISFVETSYYFIEEAKQANGRVFVHCLAGRSRSATIILGYLMMAKRLPLRQLYYTVQEKRNIILPNDGFMAQLLDYEFKLLGNRSMEQNEWKNAMKTRLNKPDALLKGDADKALTTKESCQHFYESVPVNPILVEYVNKVVHANVLLKGFNDDSFSRFKNDVMLGRDCGTNVGKLKKFVCQLIFQDTNGGEEVRKQDESISWKDISNQICIRIIEVLEKDLFNHRLP